MHQVFQHVKFECENEVKSEVAIYSLARDMDGAVLFEEEGAGPEGEGLRCGRLQAQAEQVRALPARPVPRQVAARHGRHVRRQRSGVVLRHDITSIIPSYSHQEEKDMISLV